MVERIRDVKVEPLKLIPDERGWLLEILRADHPELFKKFGQVYVSATYPGTVKAWHYHKRQVDNFACVAGMVKLVLVDTREVADARRHQRVFSWRAAAADRTSAGGRISRMEVRQPRDVARRQRADRSLRVRQPGRVPDRAARHTAI